MKEICICAALKINSEIIRGHRHCDCIFTMERMGYTKDDVGVAEEGFVTSENRFVDREEAWRLQKDAGIKSVDPRHDENDHRLFSEDLY